MKMRMNKLPAHKRVQILQLLCEGNSMRSVSRVVDVSINTVTKALEDAGARLMAHRADPSITRHNKSGTLYVTWAAVQAGLLDQVERFLADQYGPTEGDRYPDVSPLAVNLPGA